jgi:hypothetical protein
LENSKVILFFGYDEANVYDGDKSITWAIGWVGPLKWPSIMDLPASKSLLYVLHHINRDIKSK